MESWVQKQFFKTCARIGFLSICSSSKNLKKYLHVRLSVELTTRSIRPLEDLFVKRNSKNQCLKLCCDRQRICEQTQRTKHSCDKTQRQKHSGEKTQRGKNIAEKKHSEEKTQRGLNIARKIHSGEMQSYIYSYTSIMLDVVIMHTIGIIEY